MVSLAKSPNPKMCFVIIGRGGSGGGEVENLGVLCHEMLHQRDFFPFS